MPTGRHGDSYTGEFFGGKETKYYFNTQIMRKVLYKKWIPKEMNNGMGMQRAKDGTNCWEREFTHKGIFHQWGNAYEESTAGFGNYTMGLIELANGSMEQVLPTNIQFLPE